MYFCSPDSENDYLPQLYKWVDSTCLGQRGRQVELVALLGVVVSCRCVTNHPKLHGREQPPHLTESVGPEFGQSTVMRACLSTMRSRAAAGKIEMTGGSSRLRTRIAWRLLHSRACVRDKRCQLKRAGQIGINNTLLQ